jgi:hypothetical protein
MKGKELREKKMPQASKQQDIRFFCTALSVPLSVLLSVLLSESLSSTTQCTVCECT